MNYFSKKSDCKGNEAQEGQVPQGAGSQGSILLAYLFLK